MYESLPRFCKQCKTLGHSTLTCTKGLKPKSKKRSHETPTCSASSSPSAEIDDVEKQEPYCAGPSVVPQVDPISTEAATVGALRPQSPGRKRSKATVTELSSSTTPIHHSKAEATTTVAPSTRQYLTRSKKLPFHVWGCKGSLRPLLLFSSRCIAQMTLLPHPLSNDLFMFDWKGDPLVLACFIL
jgi:hypothetical protein